MADHALIVNGLQKSFGKNNVLRGIDLALDPGSVTVLMGANGAGKSTLVKVICGQHRADGGTMRLATNAFDPEDAADAIRQGVVTVHQSIDDGVIPDLDVANNLMLDRLAEHSHGLFVRERHLRTEAAKVAAAMGIEVNLRARVSDPVRRRPANDRHRPCHGPRAQGSDPRTNRPHRSRRPKRTGCSS